MATRSRGIRSRVLYITTSYPSSADDPAGHFVKTEAESEARSGSDVTVLAPGPPQRPEADHNPRVLRLPDCELFGWPGALSRLRQDPARVLGVLRFVWSTRWAARDMDPFDRVVAHWILPSAWPIALGFAAPLEIVVHGSDVALLLKMPVFLRDRILGALVRRGASLRFVSSRLRDDLCHNTRLPLRQLSRVAACRIDVSDAPSHQQARTQLGISPQQKLLVIVGRLVSSKRVAVALNAAGLVADLSVVVIGDGPERGELVRRFPTARWLGMLPRSHALAWIAAADVLLTTSRSEGASTVVREALALGTPVVATPSGDIVDSAEQNPRLTVIAAPPGSP